MNSYGLKAFLAAGGIKGRQLQYIFTDTQNDPKQTVATAQKYIADKRAGLAQFGFNNSAVDFTDYGDYIWSNSPSQSSEAPAHAAYVRDLGLKKVAVFSLNTAWGKSTAIWPAPKSPIPGGYS
jgi:branched-chain amino acid transport system substrate-binding protein